MSRRLAQGRSAAVAAVGGHDDELLGRVRGLGPEGRLLLRGAAILSMDERIGTIPSGDVLIVGDTIRNVARDLAMVDREADVVEVDLTGTVLIPGLIDAHRHCWQGQFRRIAGDGDATDYAALLHDSLAPYYAPDDIYAGTLISLLGLLNNGGTAVLDYCHNARSRDHGDAAFRAYEDAGIRVVHAFAGPYAGRWQMHWPDDVVRLAEVAGRGARPLVSVRLAVDHLQRGMTATDAVRFARQNGVGVTMDGIIGATGDAMVRELAASDALGPDVTLIHCTGLADESWAAIAEAGVSVTVATTADQMLAGMSDGGPPVVEALDRGILPSLSTDVEVSVASDLFTQMRATLAVQRRRVSELRDRGLPAPRILTQHDVLGLATIEAAQSIGLRGKVGSIVPGKAADIVAVRSDDVGALPLNSAVGTVVQAADSGSVDTVLVGGRVRKWRGMLVDVDIDRVRELVYESRNRVARKAGVAIDPFDHASAFGRQVTNPRRSP